MAATQHGHIFHYRMLAFVGEYRGYLDELKQAIDFSSELNSHLVRLGNSLTLLRIRFDRDLTIEDMTKIYIVIMSFNSRRVYLMRKLDDKLLSLLMYYERLKRTYKLIWQIDEE